jgi:site-specific recombinase
MFKKIKNYIQRKNNKNVKSIDCNDIRPSRQGSIDFREINELLDEIMYVLKEDERNEKKRLDRTDKINNLLNDE